MTIEEFEKQHPECKDCPYLGLEVECLSPLTITVGCRKKECERK